MKLIDEHIQLLRGLREHPMGQRETASPVPPPAADHAPQRRFVRRNELSASQTESPSIPSALKMLVL
jgi:hypothetical protein